jgi:hypothetical protein
MHLTQVKSRDVRRQHWRAAALMVALGVLLLFALAQFVRPSSLEATGHAVPFYAAAGLLVLEGGVVIAYPDLVRGSTRTTLFGAAAVCLLAAMLQAV